MRAVVLVGGEGTRLRPLTATMPKPLLPLVDRRTLDHVLDHLARHGVDEVVLSSPYLAPSFTPFIEERRGDPTITWITETEPLGTGGAVVNACRQLGDDPFFAVNGDILTDLDLTAMRSAHRRDDAQVTIALQHVEDARAFGLVVREADGRVRAFREKPQGLVPGDVNAGTYLIDPIALKDWEPGSAASIERDIFPRLIADGRRVFGSVSDAYWLDLGTPEHYLQAHFDLLAGRVKDVRYPAPWVDPAAEIDLRAHLGRWVAVGRAATVGAEAQIDDSVIMSGAVVAAGARVVGSILGFGARIGAGATVTGSVFGAGAAAPPGATVGSMKVDVDTVAAPG